MGDYIRDARPNSKLELATRVRKFPTQKKKVNISSVLKLTHDVIPYLNFQNAHSFRSLNLLIISHEVQIIVV